MVNIVFHLSFVHSWEIVILLYVQLYSWLIEIPGPSGSGNPLVVVGPGGDILGPTDERESVATTQSCNDHQVNIITLERTIKSNDLPISEFLAFLFRSGRHNVNGLVRMRLHRQQHRQR